MNYFLRFAAITALSLAAASAPPLITPSLFLDAQGWRGADAAYSIRLSPTKTVWLFGDTFVGRRSLDTMIRNSVAIRTCQPQCKVTYWWRGKQSGKPDAFFRTPETNYFWPLDGVLHAGQLHIFLEQMHVTNGGPMGFDYTGIKLATVANPLDPPGHWRIRYRDIALGASFIPGIAVAEEASQPDFLYVFALIKHDPQRPFLALLRMPWQELASADKDLRHWQYFSEHRQWLDWNGSSEPPRTAPLISGNITEMSIKFHPDKGQWLAVFPTSGFLAPTASLSTAKSLSGPWTSPHPFFTYPEMMRTNGHYTPNVFCYAAKEHPELGDSNTLAFTYACNSMKEPEIFQDDSLYRPILVKLPFPHP